MPRIEPGNYPGGNWLGYSATAADQGGYSSLNQQYNPLQGYQTGYPTRGVAGLPPMGGNLSPSYLPQGGGQHGGMGAMMPSFAAANPYMAAGMMALQGGVAIGDLLQQRKYRKQMQALVGQMGATGRRDINISSREARARGQQSLQSRGLQNTTVVSSMERGVERNRMRALQDLQEKLTQMQMGVTTQTQPSLTNLSKLVQTAGGLYGQRQAYQGYPGFGYGQQGYPGQPGLS